jgi:hypothetical protein
MREAWVQQEDAICADIAARIEALDVTRKLADEEVCLFSSVIST